MAISHLPGETNELQGQSAARRSMEPARTTTSSPASINLTGVAVDSKFIYSSDQGPNRIGRANLDGTGVNLDFITSGVTSPFGIAVTGNSGIYWVNHIAGPNDTAGHANVDGSNPVGSFFLTPSSVPTSVVWPPTRSFLYWLNTSGGPLAIGRAPLGGAGPDPNFIPVASAGCGRRGRRQLPVLGRERLDPGRRRWAVDPQTTAASNLQRRAELRAASPSTRNTSSGATPTPDPSAGRSQRQLTQPRADPAAGVTGR